MQQVCAVKTVMLCGFSLGRNVHQEPTVAFYNNPTDEQKFLSITANTFGGNSNQIGGLILPSYYAIPGEMLPL